MYYSFYFPCNYKNRVLACFQTRALVKSCTECWIFSNWNLWDVVALGGVAETPGEDEVRSSLEVADCDASTDPFNTGTKRAKMEGEPMVSRGFLLE